jgi:hypothetical protein
MSSLKKALRQQSGESYGGIGRIFYPTPSPTPLQGWLMFQYLMTTSTLCSFSVIYFEEI